ncbi:abortive infection family protein [Pseudomonas putida]|uniref:abortive infection family protein n=1 Tax=Pseudomonas putida TaxID=303 RepID=UPI00066EC7B6|nr:abortive infection family protein [Pseudomonas putida]
MDYSLLQDPSWRGPLITSLKRAIVEKFTEEDWHEFGHLSGQNGYIAGHGRLLRSLYWRDPDYGTCVYEVLDYLARADVNALAALVRHEKNLPILQQDQPEMLAQLGYRGGQVPAIAPSLSASEVVRRALSDADHLLASNGAQSAVDRLHTAMHGYLKSECSAANIGLPSDATITQAFKALRAHHPALSDLGRHQEQVGRILQSFAAVLDALNPVRNHGSVAHPNEHLIEPAEALLVVNAARTIFHYLSCKLSS